jgi:hypothetical protein
MALVGTMTLGFTVTMAGCRMVELYHSPRVEPTWAELAPSITREEDRVALTARATRFDDALDAAKDVLFPLSVAQLVLGVAMMLFAMRAMAARPGARHLVMQAVVVQAALSFAAHWAAPEVQRAQLELNLARTVAASKAGSSTRAAMPAAERAIHQVPIIALLIEATFAGLVVLALTRRGARAFFDGRDIVSER